MVDGIQEEHNPDGSHKAGITDALYLAIANLIYPIGSAYFNYSNPDNPATILGFGTWVAAAVGRTMVGLDAGQIEFDTAGETGGAKTVSIAHTHSTPAHQHTGTTSSHSGAGGTLLAGQDYSASPYGHTHTYDTGWTGAGISGAMSANSTPSILQPYEVWYIWRRTA
jgi:hypothetical protein